MRSIVFNVRPEVGQEEQAALLSRLSQIPGVQRAAALSPHNKNSIARRMCYAYVDDDADIHSLRDQISRQPEIESADLPADRYLAGKDLA